MDIGKKTTLHDLTAELTSYAKKREVQDTILSILKKHDLLRLRSYIQEEINRMLRGEYNRWGLSYRLHRITQLDLDTTNIIAQTLFDDVFKSVISKIDQAYDLSERGKALKDQKEKEEVYITRPLEIHDIFSDDDKDEPETIQVIDMEQHASTIKRVTPEQEKNAVKEMLGTVTLNLDDNQKKRLESAILSRLKNVRDAVDTRLALARSLDTGGVGLNDTDASDVSTMIEDYLRSKWPPPFNPKVDVKERQKSTLLTIDQLMPEDGQKEPEIILDFPRDMQSKALDKSTSQSSEQQKKPDIKFKDNPIMDERRNAVLKTIKKSADIHKQPHKDDEKKKGLFTKKSKKTPRLVGPTDELKDMTIDDWRSLFADVNDAKRGIKAKIERLGKDSFGKKIEGIKAWRSGGVNKLYLDIGTKSIEEERSIKEVVQNLMDNGQPYLTDEEFQAIMELNKEIRLMA